MVKYEVTVDGKTYEVEILLDDGRRAVLKVDGRKYEVEARNVSTPSGPATTPPSSNPATAYTASAPPRPAPAPGAPRQGPKPQGSAGEMQIRAPMPGLVLEVITSVGQRVKPGDVLLRIEAMKMENDIKSDTEGTVKEILVTKGDEVLEGAVLIVLGE